ncbi:MAG: PadR family transcriptional regulator [Candidatus Woesearchaeota archaeon]
MIKNNLKIIVLKKLDAESLSGYDLIKRIYAETGSWKPSFGSMYPLLKELHNNKLVIFKIKNRKKIYSITPSGKKALNNAIIASQNMIDMMGKQYALMETICSIDERKTFQEFIDKVHSNPVIFGVATEEMDKLHTLMMSLLSKKKFETKGKKIKKILNDTIIKLKKV